MTYVDQGEFAGSIGGAARPWNSGGKANEVDNCSLGSEALDERLHHNECTFDICLLFIRKPSDTHLACSIRLFLFWGGGGAVRGISYIIIPTGCYRYISEQALCHAYSAIDQNMGFAKLSLHTGK